MNELPVGAIEPAADADTDAETPPPSQEDDGKGSDTTPEPGDDTGGPSDTQGDDAEPSEDNSDPDSSPKPEPVSCELPPAPEICDQQNCDCMARTLGIGCEGNGSAQAVPELTLHSPYAEAAHVLAGQELPPAFQPTEGHRAILLGTGPLTDFEVRPHELQRRNRCAPQRPVSSEFRRNLTCPSTDQPEAVVDHRLPDPLRLLPVDPSEAVSCAEDPDLAGRGDCSNSLHRLINDRHCWASADPRECRPDEIHDADAFSLDITVPPGITSMSFDFAFLSAEYPFSYQHPDRFSTDAFVVWLESERWTGNVVMDAQNHPMTIDNAWLTIKDAQNLLGDCPEPCNEHDLHLYSMEGHAATPWLTTEFAVQSGERIQLTFAVMEFGSPLLDSYALIDNLRWGCTEDLKRPTTRPVR